MRDMDVYSQVMGYRWNALRRTGYSNQLGHLAGDFAYQAYKRQRFDLRSPIEDVRSICQEQTISTTYAIDMGFSLFFVPDMDAYRLEGYVLPNRYLPGHEQRKPVKAAALEFTDEQYPRLCMEMFSPAYEDEQYDHAHEHLAQLVIDKTLGVKRHESTPHIGTERPAHGVVRWAGVLEDSDQGGHCHQLSVDGHRPRIGR